MLQRIQTLYLLLAAAVSAAICIFVPYGVDANKVELYAYNNPIIFGLFIISAALSIITVFLYRNRKLQFVMGRINIILNLILLGVFVYWSLTISGETMISEKGIGMIIPVISIVLLVMANKAIKKDEDLVKSVDRLR